jgi:hypothetical protein
MESLTEFLGRPPNNKAFLDQLASNKRIASVL